MNKSVIIIVLLFCTKAFAAPIGLQGVDLGMDFPQVQKLVNGSGGNCSKYNCENIVSIKGVSTKVNYIFDKYDGSLESRLDKIDIDYPAPLYSTMLDALSSKYGSTAETANIGNNTASWHLPDGLIIIKKSTKSRLTGNISMVSNALLKEINKQNEKAAASPGF